MVKTLYKVHARWKQGVGKVRRFTYGRLRRDALRRKMSRRRGECRRCGACCHLLFKCPMLVVHEDGRTSCRIHNRRPDNCRFFPLDPRDVHERDIQMPCSTCGYHFVDDERGRGR
ncbi:MAG: hypothetical protein ACYTGH_00600 [Planctomycetota bacterium]|jgi:hypothetical protein